MIHYLCFSHDNSHYQTALFLTEIMHTVFIYKKVQGLQNRNN